MSKTINFLKYNNLTVLILLAVFLAASGVFAQTEAGQALIGEKQTKVEGVDNTLLLAADLANFNMDYTIESISEDEQYYYVKYTFLDLAKVGNAWEYQLQEKEKKVSKKSDKDLGVYLAEEFSEEYQARLKDLTEMQAEAKAVGEERRVETIAYTGLIGQTLNLANKLFPGYNPVVTNELPSPEKFVPRPSDSVASETASTPDNLTDIYNEYIKENDPDSDNIFGANDNCPFVANPEQADANENGIGDLCDSEPTAEATDNRQQTTEPAAEQTAEPTTEPTAAEPDITAEEPEQVEVIELPAAPAETPAPEQSTESAPAETGE